MKGSIMDTNVKAIMEECSKGSDEERLTFPQVVGKLATAGVERYYADLCRNEKTYYMPDGTSQVIPSPSHNALPVREFSPPDVSAAVRTIQAGKIGYREFCARIAAAGCVGYVVTLAGRRAVYYGRTGEEFVEWFPKAA
jgi:uncharacterized protein YbcV (DUF1398 family)